MGLVDRLPRQDRRLRPVEGAEGASRVLRHRRLVTAENAKAFYDANIKAEPKLDWNDIWGRVSGQIQYS